MMMKMKTVGSSACTPSRVAKRSIVVRSSVEPGAPIVPAVEPVAAAPVAAVAAAPMFLGPVQEAINGRAAMLGFVAAVASEVVTGEGIVSQLAGRYQDLELVEKPSGTSELLFGAVIAIVTLSTLMPKLIDNLDVDSRSFAVFTPSTEKLLGRVAMMGFSGLLIVELVKGSALF